MIREMIEVLEEHEPVNPQIPELHRLYLDEMGETVEFAEARETNRHARCDWAICELNTAITEGEHEAISDNGGALCAEALAEIIRQHLPLEHDGGARIFMTSAQKAYWAQVGETLGPDWIASFSHIAAFIRKVGEF
jgi:hypothetical protein